MAKSSGGGAWRKRLAYFCSRSFISVSLVSARAASVEEFYKGKTIQFIVGGSAGGGYDTYTRLIARHISQYVPGKPSTSRAEYAWGGHADRGELHL